MAVSAPHRASRPTIAIISIGAMGFGIATMLMHCSYTVVTNLDGRSETTKRRAFDAGIKVLSLPEVILQSDIILSIVPPKDAFATGQIIAATAKAILPAKWSKKIAYLDLNAISPRLAGEISGVVKSPNFVFVDGSILNFPPKPLGDGTWFKPAIVTSGPLSEAIPNAWAEDLIQTLNIRHLNEKIGAASGLKMCFASIFKGHVAIALQSYTTAQKLGVLPELKRELKEQFPAITETFDEMMMKSQQKAYRWIKEMEEIRDTFESEGGWSGDLFEGVADVFKVVAEREKEGLKEHAEVDLFVDEVSERMERRKSKL